MTSWTSGSMLGAPLSQSNFASDGLPSATAKHVHAGAFAALDAKRRSWRAPSNVLLEVTPDPVSETRSGSPARFSWSALPKLGCLAAISAFVGGASPVADADIDPSASASPLVDAFIPADAPIDA